MFKFKVRRFLVFLLAFVIITVSNNGVLQFTNIVKAAGIPVDVTGLGGMVTAQYSDSPAGEEKEKAFDDNVNTKFLTPHASAWIQYQFAGGNAYPINKYVITSANDVPLRDPKNWTLSGSTNGTAWTVLDTRSNEVFTSRHQKREFFFTNSTAYSYYRLSMTNNGPDGGNDKLQVAEIDLFENGQPGTAYSWAIGPFTRPVTTPVISPNANLSFTDPMSGTTVKWAQGQTFNPASIVKDGKMNVLFRSEDGSGVGIGAYTSRVGRATSTDGVNFTIDPAPVEYPKNDAWKNYDWYGGDEDPRVVQSESGMYALYYTMYNRGNPGGLSTVARLGVSTSTDLVNWTKQGPAFWNSGNSAVLNSFHKSASVVQKVVNGKLVAALINGKYWMYWGEDAVHLATSTDLINWTPVMNGSSLLTIFSTQSGNFDSMLTECGAPAILTKNGIVMIYNGKNSTDTTKASSLVAPGAYACGQALFSATDPTKLIDRLPEPFFKPELDFEKSGQYPQGTTFAEGLSIFNGKLFLYYGTADSYVGVATAPAAIDEVAPVYYRIKNSWTGKYLNIQNNTGKVECSNLGGDWDSARWIIEDAGYGYFKLKNVSTNQYMHIENNLGYVQYGTLGGDWGSAKWKLIDSTNGSVQFKNYWFKDQYIHVEGGLGYAQSTALGGDWGTSKWVLEPVSADYAAFYQDADFGGAGVTLGKGSYTLAQLNALGIPNDWISSLKVPSGWTVELYSDDNYGGTKTTFKSNSTYVGSAVNDTTTSIKIY